VGLEICIGDEAPAMSVSNRIKSKTNILTRHNGGDCKRQDKVAKRFPVDVKPRQI
jgi:hypothetical protein